MREGGGREREKKGGERKEGLLRLPSSPCGRTLGVCGKRD